MLISFGSGFKIRIGGGRARISMSSGVSLYMMMHRSVIMMAISTIKNAKMNINIMKRSCIGNVGTTTQSINIQAMHKN